MPYIVVLPLTPEERAFQRRVDAVWESSRNVDDGISRTFVEAFLRRSDAQRKHGMPAPSSPTPQGDHK